MGGWWSSPAPIGGMTLRVLLAGLHGSGKSHFIQTALGYDDIEERTTGMPDYVTYHNKNTVHLKEISDASLELDLFYFFSRQTKFRKHCLYFFLNGESVCDEIFTAQQWFFEAMLRLPFQFPVCILLNVRNKERDKNQLTRADVRRIFRLDVAALDRPILLVRSTFEDRKTIEWLFDWTFRNGLFKDIQVSSQ